MRDPRVGRRFAVLAWAALAVAVGPLAALGADGKPAKKDSKGPQPSQATITTAVSPSKARPGEVVTYKVTAKLESPWHIYRYAKEQPDVGPKYTEFDFFETAGLKVEGEWSPSREPTKKKEAAFPDLPFVEYHEEEVTWSVKLKVPDSAEPGKKTLRCQIAYMICSPETCLFPGQWTLPDAELTILPAAPKLAEVRSGLGLIVSGLVPQAEGPKPATKDTRLAARPKDATLLAEIAPAQAHPGETVTLKVSAKINHPWHIYKYAKNPPEDGPQLTHFDLFDPAGLVPQGDWIASREPIRRKDNAWKEIEFLEFYEGDISWSLPLQVPADAPPGKRELKLQVEFMICTDASCSPRTRMTLPPVELAVVEGAAKGEVATPTAPAPQKAPEDPPAPKSAPVAARSADLGSASASADSESETTKSPIDGGFLSFLGFCALGGLFALAMPCVWPMIPVTVNFFVKQGQARNGASTTGLAIAYCLSIILTFMAVGLAFSIFFGAASLSKLANNPWVNFGVAGLFLAFGLSLLGLFEIRLPNFLLNASAKGEGRGGIVGVMFMALTLTITSFTCTFPVVGLLLVMAANGYLFYPVVGLATFAAVLALPFFLLALSPGLLAKMPRSGDWMNTVKVVGGLIEIGAALKFINTAECVYVVPSEAWFNAYTVLTIWVVLALICGIYLLGLFRTDHDHETPKVGPIRLVTGWAFLSLALFMAPALFGRPPEGRLWYNFVGLLPADAVNLKAPTGGGGGLAESGSKATSTDPKKAEREQTAFHGVVWGMSYEGALEKAKAEKKPVLIDFTGVNCANCRTMELEVFPRPEVVRAMGDFVPVQLYTDSVPIDSIGKDDRLKLADENLGREIEFFKDVANPNYVILDGDGRLLAKVAGRMSPAAFLAFLKDGLARYKEVRASSREATSTDPEFAEREEVRFHGVPWGLSYDAAIDRAKAEGKLILAYFASMDDPNCRRIERTVFPKAAVVQALGSYVPVQLYVDLVPIASISRDARAQLGARNMEREEALLHSIPTPKLVVLDGDGKAFGYLDAASSADEVARMLHCFESRYHCSAPKVVGR